MSCPDCFTGAMHEGTPRGEVVKLHGLDAYATGPADGRVPRAIVVVIPDAFGWEFVNSRLVADHLADKGLYKVYLPDFMAGHSAPLYMLEVMRGLINGNLFLKPYYLARAATAFLPFFAVNYIGKSYPRVKAFVAALRAAEGPDTKLAVAGYCWGGKHALLLSHETIGGPSPPHSQPPRPLINAAFTGHPGFVSLPADLDDTVVAPVSFALGELDTSLPPSKVAAIRQLAEAKAPPLTGEVRTYVGVGHGFCVRADLWLGDRAAAAAAAEDQCIAWFNEHLGL